MFITRMCLRPLCGILKNNRANVAPIFAIAIIPVIGLVGAAIDYGRANSIRVGMQSALDATALAMAKVAPTLTQSQLQTQTTAYFNTLFKYPDAKNVTITPTYTTAGGSQLTIATTSTMDTTFMRVMGLGSINVGSNTTVKWGNDRLRVFTDLRQTSKSAFPTIDRERRGLRQIAIDARRVTLLAGALVLLQLDRTF